MTSAQLNMKKRLSVLDQFINQWQCILSFRIPTIFGLEWMPEIPHNALFLRGFLKSVHFNDCAANEHKRNLPDNLFKIVLRKLENFCVLYT